MRTTVTFISLLAAISLLLFAQSQAFSQGDGDVPHEKAVDSALQGDPAHALKEEDNDDICAQVDQARVLIKEREYEKAEAILGKVLQEDPKNREALFCQGELLEDQREHIDAYQLYEEILALYPGNQAALNLKYRVLMHMGANSLAKEKLEQSKDRIDPELLELLWGNEAMVRIQWKEPQIALRILERNMNYAQERAEGLPPDQPTKFLLRTLYDRIIALHENYDMKEVIQEYETLKKMNVEPPYWVAEMAGDAFLYLEQPWRALRFHQEALEKQKPLRHLSPYYETREAIYSDLVELGRYQEAGEVQEALDKEFPLPARGRSPLEADWQKADIAFERGWWLLYQDRFGQGQTYIQEVLNRAPFNTGIRAPLAHAYLWRGWPRSALTEFQIINTIDPRDIPGQIGLSYALNENDRGLEARSKATHLLLEHPKNKHIQQLNQAFSVQDMRTLTTDLVITRDRPEGEGTIEGTYFSTRIDQPLKPWRSIFARVLWRSYSQDVFQDDIWRGQVGADWRLNRDWWFTGAVSADKEGRNFGFSTDIGFDANDHLSFSALYDSYSVAPIPLRTLLEGVESEEWTFKTRFRPTEDLLAEAGASLYQMSDQNDRWSYNVKVDKALTTGAYWKTRMALEGYAETNSRTDVAYFSPRSLYSVYLIPTVEHAWYRFYDRALVDRLWVGVGQQWQEGFSSEDVWYIRYEQDYKISDTFPALLIGATYSKRDYDGQDTYVWDFYATIKKHF